MQENLHRADGKGVRTAKAPLYNTLQNCPFADIIRIPWTRINPASLLPKRQMQEFTEENQLDKQFNSKRANSSTHRLCQ